MDVSGNAKVVMAYLVNRIGDNTHFWPSQRQIAKGCGMDLKTANRAIRDLIRKGLITAEIGDFRGPRADRRARYRVVPNVGESPTLENRQRSHISNVNVGESPTSNVGESPTVIEPYKKEPIPRTKSRKAAPSSNKPRKPREPDPIWDVVVVLWFKEGVAVSQRTRVGKIVRDLKSLNATPETIRGKLADYRWQFRGFADTPEAIVKHWSNIKHDPDRELTEEEFLEKQKRMVEQR